MRLGFLLVIVLSISHSALFAQANAGKPSNCPAIAVLGPNSAPLKNELLPFTLSIDKSFDASKLKLKWLVSGGKIISGQGTTSIKVKNLINGSETTATVEISGLPPGCQNTASASASIDTPPLTPEPVKVAEFELFDNQEFR